MRSWWPSRAGAFAGVSLIRQASDGLLDPILETCRIGAAEVDMVNLVFGTSRLYENLGIDVLVRASECSAVIKELSEYGGIERSSRG